ncbi:hypothetical protein [Niallia nealsonii]|uniref:hypothetical protein n=1 Tax=Niallia nealsonii TaxID=115979 RepID=UPI0012FF4B99|nr:hypothetical protein [Niallia nealsonii]
MIFGELICKLRGYHKFNYYYSGQCITCGEMRKEHQEISDEKIKEEVVEKQQEPMRMD